MNDFLRAIPTAATHPLAMVMYLATVAAWVYVSRRNGTLTIVMDKITALPDHERRTTIADILHEAVPANMSPETFLKHKRNQYYLIGFISILATLIIIAALSTYYAGPDKNKAAFNLIEKALEEASSIGASADNTLVNGTSEMSYLADAMKTYRNDDTRDEADEIDRLRMNDPSMNNLDSVMNYLKQKSPAAKLQKLNSVLQGALDTIDNILSPIADCYRKDECGKSADNFDKLCVYVNREVKAAIQLNTMASNSGVLFNESDSKPLFGDGPMDPYFQKLHASSLAYLHNKICVG